MTIDGRPLRERRCAFSEAFIATTLAACARAAADEPAAEEARRVLAAFRRLKKHTGSPASQD